MLYNLLRGLHILAVVAWMAGLLYLPRLFVYHCRAPAGSEMDATFQEMEAKLLRIIMTPAMVAVFVLGGALIWAYGADFGWSFVRSVWIWIMILGAVALAAWQYYLEAARRGLAAGQRIRSERFWRMVNEIPFVIAFVIVISVTLKVGG